MNFKKNSSILGILKAPKRNFDDFFDEAGYILAYNMALFFNGRFGNFRYYSDCRLWFKIQHSKFSWIFCGTPFIRAHSQNRKIQILYTIF